MNITRSPRDRLTLSQLIDREAREHGERIALVEGSAQVSYDTLATRASEVAAGLYALGVRRGDAVAVWLPNRVEWIELVFAAARLGATVVGVNTRYRAHEVLHALRTSAAKVLVIESGFKGIDFAGTLEEMAPELPDSLETVIDIAGQPLALTADVRTSSYSSLRSTKSDLPDRPGPDTPSNAFSSSGTTGAPKLVLHSQHSITAHAEAIADAFGYRAEGTVVLAALPVCGVFGFNTVLSALAAGATAVLLPEFSASGAVQAMREHEVTHTNLADEMLRRIIDEPDALSSLNTWRECGFGAFTALDPRSLVAAGDAAGKKFFQTFGSSEVQALVTYPSPEADAERRAIGGGVPCHPDVRVRIRDDDGTLCELDTPGEIEISGPNITCGYYGIDGIPDLDDEGYFRTGDLGKLLSDRDFAYISRRGDALRLAGFLVNPREIETYLESLPGVSEAQVVGVAKGNELVPAAFLRAESGSAIDVDEVYVAARRDLANFKVPRLVEVLTEFPVTRGTNGTKIQRTALRDQAQQIWDAQQAARKAPR